MNRSKTKLVEEVTTHMERIKEYFDLIGYPAPFKGKEDVKKYLKKKFGYSVWNETRVYERKLGYMPDEFVYRDLDLAIAVERIYSFELLEDFLESIIVNEDVIKGKVLELTCGAGLICCFIAKYFPDAEVYGVDIRENAIRCANELKERLGLTNVSFEVVDRSTGYGTYDVLICDRVFATDKPYEMECMHWYDNLIKNTELFSLEYAKEADIIANLVKDGGWLFNRERLDLINEDALGWCYALAKCGFDIDETGMSGFSIMRMHPHLTLVAKKTSKEKSIKSVIHSFAEFMDGYDPYMTNDSLLEAKLVMYRGGFKESDGYVFKDNEGHIMFAFTMGTVAENSEVLNCHFTLTPDGSLIVTGMSDKEMKETFYEFVNFTKKDLTAEKYNVTSMVK